MRGRWTRRQTGIYRFEAEEGARVREPRWLSVYRDPEGKQKSKTFRTREEAIAYREKMRTDRRGGNYIDPAKAKTPFSEWWAQFMGNSIGLARSTRALYESLGRKYIVPHLGGHQLGAITPRVVSEWVTIISREAKPPTVNAAYRVLRRVLTAAVDAEMIARNPARRIHVPKGEHREMRVPTPAEVAAIGDAVPERYRALILLLGIGGPRIGESLALTEDDVDLVHSRVHITKALTEVGGKVEIGRTKTGKSRSISLPRFLRDALEAHLEAYPPGESGLVFTAEKGGPIHRTTWRRRVWVPALKKAGIAEPWPRIHDLRHGAASFMISIGAHPKAVSEALGHSSITITIDRYGHLLESLSDSLAQRMDAGWRAQVGERKEIEPPVLGKLEPLGPVGPANGNSHLIEMIEGPDGMWVPQEEAR